MNRFFCFSFNVTGRNVTIDAREHVHHIRDVLRLKPKDEVIAFDERGNEYKCLIERIGQKVILQVISKKVSLKEKAARVAVACAIPKKAKFDDIVDKLTQLGVERIIPMFTARVVIKWSKEKKISQKKRWEKIAVSATQQSQRSGLPQIDEPSDFKQVLAEAANYELKLIPHLSGERKTLKNALGAAKPKNILVLIGPEGDFTAQEIKAALSVSFIAVSLGDTVLRVDTAAIAIASFIRLYENS